MWCDHVAKQGEVVSNCLSLCYISFFHFFPPEDLLLIFGPMAGLSTFPLGLKFTRIYLQSNQNLRFYRGFWSAKDSLVLSGICFFSHSFVAKLERTHYYNNWVSKHKWSENSFSLQRLLSLHHTTLLILYIICTVDVYFCCLWFDTTQVTKRGYWIQHNMR